MFSVRNVLILTSITLIVVDEVCCNTSDLFESAMLNELVECKRSFKFLYSDNTNIVHKILDRTCLLVKKFVPHISHSFLKGKICEWNGDANATDNFFRIGYNHIEDKIENNVFIKKAVDVIEKRYLNNLEISGFYQVVRTCTDHTVETVAPMFIPIVKNKISSTHLDGPLIERMVNFVATVAEVYSNHLTQFWLRNALKRFSYVEQETKEGVAKNFVDNLFHFFIKSNYEAPVLIDQVRQESILKNHQYEINAILKILFEASAGTPLTKAIFIAYYFQREDDTVKRKPYEQKIEHLWKLCGKPTGLIEIEPLFDNYDRPLHRNYQLYTPRSRSQYSQHQDLTTYPYKLPKIGPYNYVPSA